MTIQVLGLNASPRGKESRTLQIVEAVLAGARDEGAKTEYNDVYSLDIQYCNACTACYATGECVLCDDFSELFGKMMDADGIVLGAPNYIDSIPAPMKAVFDRMADAVHCRMFSGKYGCSVCTAGGANHERIVEYLNHALNAFGAITVGGVGVSVGRGLDALSEGEKNAHALGRVLVQSIRGEHVYHDQEEYQRERRDYFRQLILWNKDKWTHEYEWYVQNGWIKEED